jgi:regulator of protease activity HflC (stomatin/prohibitin superfamily)
MVSSVTAAPQTQPAAQSAPESPKPVHVKPKVAVKDTVNVSAAAKAMQEATETPAQTAKEAQRGDKQAQILLAKEKAEKDQ